MTMLSKPTIDDIEAHGYKVLTKSEYEQMNKRLEVLERVSSFAVKFVHARQARGKRLITQKQVEQYKQESRSAERRLIEAVVELEAMGNGNPQP